ncbi:tubulointerstitial nephritis antigen-like [Aricia agestis]|uniref:tubulointerstitial nephritis antigen-like n=1 Tax=Aricia agestis TaxID=91739 RepID=UPI001C20C416|nr:tubulointerstitial nephritis antigen-like [Aricia agestis]
MENITRLLFLFAALSAAAAYWRPGLENQPYCAIDNRCCKNREDDCSHRILDTICYCDEFCNRSRTHDDCCPDYEEVCLGIVPPPPLTRQPCRHHNDFYEIGDKRQDNCNTCQCIADENNPNGGRWSCEKDECLMSDEVVNGVSRAGLGWRARNYTQFYGKKLQDGIKFKLGTLPLTAETQRMVPIRYEKDIAYPNNFDSRTRWPQFISPIVDQGWCGSDWAVSIASIASDRFAIQSNGAERMILSPQSLLSCNRRQQKGCEGGHIDVAWNFARNEGLLDEECFPYTANVTRCPFKPRGSLIQDGCRPAVRRRTSRYKVGPPGRLDKEQDIMFDIMESGPVQAVMTVYQDFFHYQDGIYRRSPYGNNRYQGLHSVRIVGWGEDYQGKYWIVANSWGREWGENGYFRIARGDNESGIESFIVTVLADVTEAQRK